MGQKQRDQPSKALVSLLQNELADFFISLAVEWVETLAYLPMLLEHPVVPESLAIRYSF